VARPGMNPATPLTPPSRLPMSGAGQERCPVYECGRRGLMCKLPCKCWAGGGAVMHVACAKEVQKATGKLACPNCRDVVSTYDVLGVRATATKRKHDATVVAAGAGAATRRGAECGARRIQESMFCFS
jgi:hypothetical protein